MIEVRGLAKHFRVHRRQPGLRASLRSLVRREHVTVRAVEQVSFTIPAGEVVGFLGPNGAGKTTTLKCLTGLLHPTAGTVRVLGHNPHRREPAFLLLLGCAVLLMYALSVLLMALAVVLVAAEELGRVSYAFVELSRFPVELYRNPVQAVLTVVPVAFLTTYPAAALLGRLDAYLLLVAPAVAAGAVVAATLAWRRSLRSYAGASA